MRPGMYHRVKRVSQEPGWAHIIAEWGQPPGWSSSLMTSSDRSWPPSDADVSAGSEIRLRVENYTWRERV
ncbi:hypothetical protein KFL_008900030 [Klebsormidium nitens]|uniref:Uncharacterized protein n=1 Tax=Klebsormidium nitens TaxID=105231 RepID=A0A1Y1IT24_KLENI|nr:hypothetical protein KFL_008900030 [Klebsormidium nitens]|eukprot:GAQ91956.1 hypothetical protein KFL_008900030 [Klebsormidium nitens]